MNRNSGQQQRPLTSRRNTRRSLISKKTLDAATYQTFIKRRSEKLKPKNARFSTRQYRKLTYKWVRYSEYKPEGPGNQQFVHSRKKGCRAEIRLSAQLPRGELEAQSRHEAHNHPLSELIWKHLPENRRLDKEQQAQAMS